jgi:DNA-directed RNA polymerase subunit M/transcription elongation factor TFIIS
MSDYENEARFVEKCPECGDIVARREIRNHSKCYKCKRQSLNLSDPYSSSLTFKDNPPTPKEVIDNPSPTPKEVNKWTGLECPRCHKINAPFIDLVIVLLNFLISVVGKIWLAYLKKSKKAVDLGQGIGYSSSIKERIELKAVRNG